MVAFHNALFDGDDVHSSRSWFVSCGVQQTIDYKSYLSACCSQWVCQIRFALFIDRRLWESCVLIGRLVPNLFYFDMAQQFPIGTGVVVRGQLWVDGIRHLREYKRKIGVFENLKLIRNLTTHKNGERKKT